MSETNNSHAKIDFFNQLISEHEQQLKANVFSENWADIKANTPHNMHKGAKLVFNETTRLMYDPNDLEYGVTSNAKSYQRGVKANKHIQREVEELCEIIRSYGAKKNDSFEIKFKTLFSLYVKISNKLVGLLLRARKHGYVEFPGEILFQGRDDEVTIKLIKNN